MVFYCIISIVIVIIKRFIYLLVKYDVNKCFFESSKQVLRLSRVYIRDFIFS